MEELQQYTFDQYIQLLSAAAPNYDQEPPRWPSAIGGLGQGNWAEFQSHTAMDAHRAQPLSVRKIVRLTMLARRGQLAEEALPPAAKLFLYSQLWRLSAQPRVFRRTALEHHLRSFFPGVQRQADAHIRTQLEGQEVDFALPAVESRFFVFLLYIGDPVQRLVLKALEQPLPTVMADQFLRIVGFETPHGTITSKQSDTGKWVVNWIEGHHDELREDIGDRVERYDRMWEGKLAASTHIVLMNRLAGTTFQELDKHHLRAVFKSTSLLTQIGAAALSDLILDNRDRIFSPNFGNIMLAADGDRILLIDNDTKVSADTLFKINRLLKRILTKKGSKALFLPLIEHLKFRLCQLKVPESKVDGWIDKYSKRINRSLHQGVIAQARRIKECLSRRERVFQALAPFGADEPDLQVLQQIATIIDGIPDMGSE